MKALVIGANGFIGSHVTDVLAADGHQVLAFDRYSNAPAFVECGNVTPFVGEFLNQDDVSRALTGTDMVFHFLSSSSPATADADPTFDIRTNVAPTVELLRLSVDAGVKRVYFASSGGAIYGNAERETLTEMDVADPVSPYAIGKLTVENYLNYFAVKHGLESVALRISNPYGPRQHAQRRQGLIPIALRAIHSGDSVTQFGDGTMVRDYIFVEDLAQMIARTFNQKPRSRTYNLGSGLGHSVLEIFDVIRSVIGTDFAIETRTTPSTFVARSVLDTGRFVAEFGQVPLLGIREGIARTWASINQ